MARHKQAQRVQCLPAVASHQHEHEQNMFSSPLWRGHRETRVLGGSLDAQLTFSQAELPWCAQTSRSHNGTSPFPLLMLYVPLRFGERGKGNQPIFVPLPFPRWTVNHRPLTAVPWSLCQSTREQRRVSIVTSQQMSSHDGPAYILEKTAPSPPSGCLSSTPAASVCNT